MVGRFEKGGHTQFGDMSPNRVWMTAAGVLLVSILFRGLLIVPGQLVRCVVQWARFLTQLEEFALAHELPFRKAPIHLKGLPVLLVLGLIGGILGFFLLDGFWSFVIPAVVLVPLVQVVRVFGNGQTEAVQKELAIIGLHPAQFDPSRARTAMLPPVEGKWKGVPVRVDSVTFGSTWIGSAVSVGEDANREEPVIYLRVAVLLPHVMERFAGEIELCALKDDAWSCREELLTELPQVEEALDQLALVPPRSIMSIPRVIVRLERQRLSSARGNSRLTAC